LELSASSVTKISSTIRFRNAGSSIWKQTSNLRKWFRRRAAHFPFAIRSQGPRAVIGAVEARTTNSNGVPE
jgi:hypothetical protein